MLADFVIHNVKKCVILAHAPALVFVV